jgi:hypothetical protein
VIPNANSHPDAAPPGAPDLTPEQMRCPTCGYSVYGLTESRCPECGGEFSWDDVRRIAEGEDQDLFEHGWKRRPVRSLLTTWYSAAFHPVRLWSRYDLFSRFEVFPLLVFLVLQALLFRYGWDAVARVVDPTMNGFAIWLAQSAVAPWAFTYNIRVLPDFFHVVALWWITTYGVMLLLFDPADKPGSRWLHLLRIYVHATAFASCCFAAWCILEAIVDLGHFFLPLHPVQPVQLIGQRVYTWLGNIVLGLALVVTWANLWVAYRRYLRMPHGWAIAGIALFTGGIAAELIRLFI